MIEDIKGKMIDLIIASYERGDISEKEMDEEIDKIINN
jgi:hypothetical protein